MLEPGIKIEIHLLQNFAPSNLNRDDTGQPKSATFGGFRRARISSQCTKRSARQYWRERATVPVGDRTKLLRAALAPGLAADGRTEEQINTALDTFLTDLYSKLDGEKTKVLLFVSPQERQACIDAINEHWDALSAGRSLSNAEKKAISGRISESALSADIALFGRMLAEQPGRNTDGACQVAHPISTHKIDMEMDFYTAIDDLRPGEVTGADMMGVVGFNSACYYRYALIDRDQLARNLAGKTARINGAWKDELTDGDYAEADTVIEAFIEAMVHAIPTGKQNGFAAQNLPAFGLFIRRKGGVPVSLANAFAKPVRPTSKDDDLVGLSIQALAQHWDTLNTVYGAQGVDETACFHLGYENRLNGLGNSDKQTLENAIAAVMKREPKP